MTALQQLATGLANGTVRTVDLTHTLDPEFPVMILPPEFGQCARFRVEEVSRYDERGPGWYWRNFSCGEHTGTHFDAPIHWISGRDLPNATVDAIPAESFAIRFLVETRDIIGFGTETVGTDAGQGAHLSPPYPAHYILHGAGKLGLQCLANLDQLPATGAILICPPLKIKHGSGSPLRVLALVEG